MDIYNMVQLVKLLEILDSTIEKGEHKGKKHWIYDWIFCKDGKSILVETSNHECFTFTL